ncbi:MAG: hypothetical protein HDQ96_16165 [Lachnospiraceae bacterium]|nr:hypothetical protein [Lachnospiraceae bacterium]
MCKTELLFSLFVSCIVIVFIMFQFWNEKYEKKYQNKYLNKLLASVYVISVTETIGVYLIDFLMKILDITPDKRELLNSIEYAFSKIVMLFLYYVLFAKLWKK